jgi:plastocyanin
LALPVLGAVIVAVVALLLRSGSPASHESVAAARMVRSGHVTVSITNYAYVPNRLTVRAGTTVTFVNRDSTAHTATADHGGFATGTIDPRHRRTVTLSRPGTYPYHCVFHAFMTGTITVVAR